MSKYTPKNEWHPKIQQFDINEIVEGGESGIDNIPHHQLADCIFYLLTRLSLVEASVNYLIAGVAPNPDDGTVEPDPADNPLGEWIITKGPSVAPARWGGISEIYAVHSSGQKIKDVTLTTQSHRASDGVLGLLVPMTPVDTNDTGEVVLKGMPGYFDIFEEYPEVDFIISAPNTTTLTTRYYMWDGNPHGTGPAGTGGNANQTE